MQLLLCRVTIRARVRVTITVRVGVRVTVTVGVRVRVRLRVRARVRVRLMGSIRSGRHAPTPAYRSPIMGRARRVGTSLLTLAYQVVLHLKVLQGIQSLLRQLGLGLGFVLGLGMGLGLGLGLGLGCDLHGIRRRLLRRNIVPKSSSELHAVDESVAIQVYYVEEPTFGCPLCRVAATSTCRVRLG